LSHELRQSAKDAQVIAATRHMSAQYPRDGYRRIRIFRGARECR
jgi:putative transposase